MLAHCATATASINAKATGRLLDTVLHTYALCLDDSKVAALGATFDPNPLLWHVATALPMLLMPASQWPPHLLHADLAMVDDEANTAVASTKTKLQQLVDTFAALVQHLQNASASVLQR